MLTQSSDVQLFYLFICDEKNENENENFSLSREIPNFKNLKLEINLRL